MSCDYNILSQNYLNILYQNVKEHCDHNHHKENMSLTYGEILAPSINKLLTKIKLSDQDIFVDFGSGIGKAVVQFFLNSCVKEAHGIELLPKLHQRALFIAGRISNDLPQFFISNRKLTFVQGDFLQILFPKATIALVVSTCFNPPLLLQLGKIINNTPSIHTVLTLRPIATLQSFSFREAVPVECSWDSALCYIYRRK